MEFEWEDPLEVLLGGPSEGSWVVRSVVALEEAPLEARSVVQSEIPSEVPWAAQLVVDQWGVPSAAVWAARSVNQLGDLSVDQLAVPWAARSVAPSALVS